MTEGDLRALVRTAVERHLAPAVATPTPVVAPALAAHPSFVRYALPSGRESDGPCLVEPGVRCNHCGFCQSHGY